MANEPNLDGAVYKELQCPEAYRLAELYLLEADLKAAYAALELYFSKYATSGIKVGRGPIIAASLFRDGVLLYCSCFSTKDANKLDPEAVYAGVEDWEEYYTALTDMRSAFVAHNFGPQRQHTVVVACLEDEGRLYPAAFTQVYLRFGGWTVAEEKRLLSFIDVAREHLKKRIVEAEAAVTEIVVALTPDDTESLPNAELSIPGRQDFRTTRERYRQKGSGSRLPLPERRLGQTIVLG